MKRIWLTLLSGIFLGGCKETPQTAPNIQVIQPYQVTARVIATKRYKGDHDYWAPLDAILAWGPLTNPKHTEGVTFAQEGRWYHWYPPPTADRTLIANHTANTHLVADDEASRALILSLEEGKTYFLEGALVNIRLAPNKEMRSSTSRTDSGSGACEVFLLKKATLAN